MDDAELLARIEGNALARAHPDLPGLVAAHARRTSPIMAIKEVQRTLGVPVTGDFDPISLKALGATDAEPVLAHFRHLAET